MEDSETKPEAGKKENSKNPYFVWFAFGILLLGLPIAIGIKQHANNQFQGQPQSPALVNLPKYGTVPNFSLRDEDNKAFTQNDLGKDIWIVNFIFTSCTDTCPKMTHAMERFQKHIKEYSVPGIKMLSFTVDPEHDTPEKLKAYAKASGADPALWKFVTGDFKALQETIVKGFKMPLSDGKEERGKVENKDFFGIVHGEQFIVVDSNHDIRGYFDVVTEQDKRNGYKNIMQAIDILQRESQRKTMQNQAKTEGT